jgi:hypothetical protein
MSAKGTRRVSGAGHRPADTWEIVVDGSAQASERVQRGLAVARAAGHPHGRHPFGYQRYYDRGNFAEQVPDPGPAEVVRAIYSAIAAGESVQALAVRLTRAGVSSPGGGRIWYASTVTGIVGNPAYRPHPTDPDRACRTYGGQLLDTPAAWPPLVDESTWQAAQRVLGGTRSAARERAPGRIRYLLSGNADVMRAPCGSLLSGWPRTAGRGATYACRFDRCVSAPMPELDEVVIGFVVDRLARPGARELLIGDDIGRHRAAAELHRLRDELDEARRSFAAPGGISAAALAMKEAAMATAIDDAQRRAQPAGLPPAVSTVIEAAETDRANIRPAWDALPLLARRAVVSTVFESLTLGPMGERITRWTPPPERLAIVGRRVQARWRTP